MSLDVSAHLYHFVLLRTNVYEQQQSRSVKVNPNMESLRGTVKDTHGCDMCSALWNSFEKWKDSIQSAFPKCINYTKIILVASHEWMAMCRDSLGEEH